MFIRRRKLIELLEKLQERDNLRHHLEMKLGLQLQDLLEKYPDTDTSRWLSDRSQLEKDITDLDEAIEELEQLIELNHRRGMTSDECAPD